MVDETESKPEGTTDDPEWDDAVYATKRERGILTEQDRRYLTGEADLDGQDERNARYRIRKRALHSLPDAMLLKEALPDRDVRQIANNEEFIASMSVYAGGLTGLAYRLLSHEDSTRDPVSELESAMEVALELAELDRVPDDADASGVDVSVDIKISRDTVEAEEVASVLRKIAKAEEKPVDDLPMLLTGMAGDTDRLREEVEELLEED